ncbi:hypothetical protein MASR1M42_15430 [Azonexus hydrophilus]
MPWREAVGSAQDKEMVTGWPLENLRHPPRQRDDGAAGTDNGSAGSDRAHLRIGSLRPDMLSLIR